MAKCQGCGTDLLSQDHYCKNCGAPVAASVEDLADTRRFDPSAPAVTTGSLEQNDPLYVPAPATHPFAHGSTPASQMQSFIKSLIHRKLFWLLAFFLLTLFTATGVTIGREAVRARRMRRMEQAREAVMVRKARERRQAAVAQRSSEESIRNALGFMATPVLEVEYPENQGVFVNSLTSDDSAAALAQIQAGDVLFEFGDQPVPNCGELARVINTVKPGSEVGVKLYRDEQLVATRIRVGSPTLTPFQPKIDPRTQGFLGVGDVGRRCCVSGTKRWGLEIHRIIDNSPADLFGLQLGDVITELDNKTLRTPDELARRIHAINPRSKVKVKFYRGSTEQTVDLIMGHGWNSEVAKRQTDN
jgi:membrane-associated protease RseP (regulator of RpoE activity)